MTCKTAAVSARVAEAAAADVTNTRINISASLSSNWRWRHHRVDGTFIMLSLSLWCQRRVDVTDTMSWCSLENIRAHNRYVIGCMLFFIWSSQNLTSWEAHWIRSRGGGSYTQYNVIYVRRYSLDFWVILWLGIYDLDIFLAYVLAVIKLLHASRWRCCSDSYFPGGSL